MYKQYELPYSYDALEPIIDTLTMETHYDKHHATYTAKLNALVDRELIKDVDICDLLSELDRINDATLRMEIRNNGGGYYNHNLYFSEIGPCVSKQPKDELLEKMNRTFGSFDEFKSQISNLAVSQFGSGWAWLSVTPEGELVLSKTCNQDNPLILGTENTPIFTIDVWEHAYYLKYKNMRAEYVKNFFEVVDWDVVEKNYYNAIQNRRVE